MLCGSLLLAFKWLIQLRARFEVEDICEFEEIDWHFLAIASICGGGSICFGSSDAVCGVSKLAPNDCTGIVCVTLRR